ncbi:hypothetical protein HXX76_010841 [Chlamydomonas incerta]|uniref:BRISC and BRCA1-A complex member 2 n=1 Tax=Chlamydomonas incerta TaxID=51695 RepID=A0A835SM54_CHLIN|nr:hypothetical protein HXX76_010841 [Chlamydomonas incerta]|eukprot:KAG2429608.1 hypothetical protein HXX76_010841 [Chlamydomonas incerta]
MALHAQLRQLRQDLSCNATLDYLSPHCRIVNLSLPWCGRQLRWQLVFGPPSSNSPPDIVFDDESFRPLCATFTSSSAATASSATAFATAAAALAAAAPGPAAAAAGAPHARTGSIGGGRGGSSSSSGGCGPAALRAQLLGWPAAAGLQPESAAAAEALSRLVRCLLEAYRLHQRTRLEAAAARLPRLQFELSTLDTGGADGGGGGGGVQMELQAPGQAAAGAAASGASGAAAAVFSVPLPGVDLTQLLQLAVQLGARLPSGLLPPPAAAAAAPGAEPAAGAQGEGGTGGEGGVLEPLLPAGAAGPGGSGGAGEGAGQGDQEAAERLSVNRGPASPGAVAGAAAAAARSAAAAASGAGAGAAGQSLPTGSVSLSAAAAAAPGSAAGAAKRAAALPPLVLQASFRLPPAAGGAAGGDMADPELMLLVPPVLVDLQAQSTSPLPPGVVAASSLGGGGGAAVASGSGAAGAAGGGHARRPNSSGGGSFVAAGAGGGGGGGGAKIGVSLLPPFLLPLWSAHMCLAEYIPLAADRLRLQIDAHCLMLSTRLQLLSLLGDMLGGPPLELNAAAGTALYGVAWEGAAVLLGLELGGRFPSDKPAITLQSVRMLGAPDASRTYRDYPWSPRWAAREMAARIHNWVQDELPNFLRTRLPPPPPPS